MAGGPATSRSCPGTATTVTRTAPGSSGGSSWTPAGGPGGTRTATWRSWWSGRPGRPGVQNRTGGERLGTGWLARTWVRVIGYPDGEQWPVICGNRTRPFGRHQLRFDCGGYPDGTSGGPFLARWNGADGRGPVIGG